MTLPLPDATVTMESALRQQRDSCAALGSPVAAQCLDAVLASEPVMALLPTTARAGDLPGLRVLACLHRLAIERAAPALVAFFPTLGGSGPFGGPSPERAVEAFDDAVAQALVDHAPALAASMARIPQTNETGRARLLRCALAHLPGSGVHLPVRLVEVACSAGLNLRADALPGDPALEPGPLPAIVERIGCDLDPVDPTTQEGRTLLSSYIWVDDVERFARLGAALEIAARIPVRLVRAEAEAFLGGLAPAEGAVTVIWHSAMRPYLDDVARAAMDAQIDRIGAEAADRSPMLHAAWEPDGDEFALTCRLWDGHRSGEPVVLARGATHGSPAALLAGSLVP